ncbi:9473_t:CDS:1, partial [Entrophospora sp. SA101]
VLPYFQKEDGILKFWTPDIDQRHLAIRQDGFDFERKILFDEL